ncbi:GNAT family N-acetyltransferase [Draconibacterium sp. IB214405]|uniref:GNAT family N-acetyltransferase n=1 Tax=Draconibacterium sp. IB214405 TaxID=3097352 RepID=UPI002A0BC975|nr:GNAT family N-acetyltransferase [Draconibacterium sp. IB214405]MDX8338428.1 GNAT family N-acetyltransferase [Draconibacterium sp. IB214405]
MKSLNNIKVLIAEEVHLKFIDDINDAIDSASKQRGTGIARRTYEYLADKMKQGKAIIALEDGKVFAGFCYIETWQEKGFVANSGLIVAEDYRGIGLAKAIKKKAFELSRKKYPNSKIFGLTTGLAVMKINHELGYRPVTFSELTLDDQFWKGCEGCINHDILERTGRTKCLCTGMLYNPEWEKPTFTSTNGIRKRSLMDLLPKRKFKKEKQVNKENK